MKITAIISAKNEEKTIGKVISAVNEVVDEIIVVSKSSDNTNEIARSMGTRVLSQIGSGKGLAMKQGLEAASGDIVVFVDADLLNIQPEWIEKLIEPIMNNEADIVKAEYVRKGIDAPVTKLVAKPMLKTMFPDIGVASPLDGEISAKKETFENLEFREDWGVDIGLVLSAHTNGFKIKNVYLGEKKHKASFKKDIDELSEMSENIIWAIMSYYEWPD